MIVDLSDLRFADRSLMLDLACLAQRLRAHDRVLWLSGAQPHIRALIVAAGLPGLPAVRLVAGPPALTRA